MSHKSLDEVNKKHKHVRIRNLLQNVNQNMELAEIVQQNNVVQLLPDNNVMNRNERHDQEIQVEERPAQDLLHENNEENEDEYWNVGEPPENNGNILELVENKDEEEDENDIFDAAIQDQHDDSDIENDQEPRDNGEGNNDNVNPNIRIINDNADRNQPLYQGAEITTGQSMLLILALLLHHNLTMTCIEDIIIVLELHCLSEGLIKNSLYKFRNYFGLNTGTTNITKHYYCSTCSRDLRLANDVCPTCPRRKNSYFVELPFIRQLQEMYARPGFYDLLQLRYQRPHVPGIISEIYDGSLYQTWINNGFLSNPHNISFSWYTDGIPIFKSPGISIWPVYLTINELPFKDRKKRQNTLLIGFWYGNKKPNMNILLYKFRPELERMANGVEIKLPDNNSIVVKGVVLMGTCDLPAKCECLNFTQYNGKHGCPSCLCAGRSEQVGPTNYVHVYPYENNLTLRTSAQCIEDAYNARPNEPVRGVKGHSTLSRIMPDFVRGMGIDRMHGVDGGVVKKILTLLFDVSYRNYAFSLYNFIDIVNSRLTSIKPPKFIHRMPRSVADLIHWKASELKMYFFYFSIPVFEGIMRIDYFEHYLRLVTAISILSFNEVTVVGIQVADNLLHRFVREFETLYGIQFCSINIHQLLHLPDCVWNLGPLWAYTCYEYEDINGQLLKLIHGTWHIDTQIANSQSQFIKMTRLVEELTIGKIRTFCLFRKKQVKIIEAVHQHCYSVGTYKKLQVIPEFIMNTMQRSGIQINNFTMIWQYFRLLKNEKLYVSDTYSRELQTQSSVAQFQDNQQHKLGLIHFFIKVLHCNCMQAICNCVSRHYAIVQDIISDSVFLAVGDNASYNSNQFLHKCHEVNTVAAIPIEKLLKVCIFMKIDDQLYVALPINDKELE